MLKNYFPLLFILSIVMVAGCKSPDPPILKEIRNVKIGSIINNEMIVSGEALVMNPNNFSATLNSLNLEVFLEDKKIATIQETVSYKILPNEDSAIPLRGTIDLKTVEKILNEKGLKILMGQELPLLFKGTARAKVHGVNMKIPVNYIERINLKNIRL